MDGDLRRHHRELLLVQVDWPPRPRATDDAPPHAAAAPPRCRRAAARRRRRRRHRRAVAHGSEGCEGGSASTGSSPRRAAEALPAGAAASSAAAAPRAGGGRLIGGRARRVRLDEGGVGRREAAAIGRTTGWRAARRRGGAVELVGEARDEPPAEGGSRPAHARRAERVVGAPPARPRARAAASRRRAAAARRRGSWCGAAGGAAGSVTAGRWGPATARPQPSAEDVGRAAAGGRGREDPPSGLAGGERAVSVEDDARRRLGDDGLRPLDRRDEDEREQRVLGGSAAAIATKMPSSILSAARSSEEALVARELRPCSSQRTVPASFSTAPSVRRRSCVHGGSG